MTIFLVIYFFMSIYWSIYIYTNFPKNKGRWPIKLLASIIVGCSWPLILVYHFTDRWGI